MFDVVLVYPEIPPNTGNAIRLCANTGTRLHLVEPLGFELTAARLKRAGMDYAELAPVRIHADWFRCVNALRELSPAGQWYALTTKGTRHFADSTFRAGDVFVFGCETRGLPPEILAGFSDEQRLRLPMVPNNRSINLSNAVAVTVYEAWRQIGYPGAL
ncbi:MAG TPA: tRNA (cytidine(34)-2'-O)-methyltransferase [Accumulibacter sp.]|nr:tRNA (cytidine(34)-2'-O)-methyltransferase [Accumulibacter sp.]HMX21886.1 tRNA (cytidine(34)-2'-O)-methyltransferase [Accumulibacter sp.]HMY06462.1 tRNA (cytidine(34)-2'-O)-methyltransferase [Accumulibacter sp.]HNC18362.1 tRNA (cytidine(34)-2'-O)-methyltransferase [Accumulibacter sp.]HND80614.1 tRNA (cytidine(34)-2'-O)-methyltransferase [Accumulibacter sp.]